MTCPEDLWFRAKDALRAGTAVHAVSPDTAASRAYYAAFYAASALFAADGRTFKKNSAVEGAVHRDLVRTGTWPRTLGEAYSRLARLRRTADYGGGQHVPPEEAAAALAIAADVLRAVADARPDTFTDLD